MGWSIHADGRLDRTHQWQNQNDRVEYERAFKTGRLEDQKMALAQLCSDPNTPPDEIRSILTNGYMPTRLGYHHTEPTIARVLDVEAPHAHSLFDFTNTAVSQQSTMRPALGDGPND